MVASDPEASVETTGPTEEYVSIFIPPPETIYFTNALFRLYSHSAPPIDESISHIINRADKEFERVHGRIGNCKRHNTPLPSNKEADLEIVLDGPLSTGWSSERCKQIWKVRTLNTTNQEPSSPPERPLVARFYDPLYTKDTWLNPFNSTLISIAKECAAYRQLESIQGHLVPRFRGLYICSTSSTLYTPDAHSPQGKGGREYVYHSHPWRNVFVVLLEYVEGRDLYSVDRELVCTEHKAKITEEIGEAVEKMFVLGVNNFDVTPRNVILCPTREETREEDLRSGDSGIAWLRSYCSEPSPFHHTSSVASLRVVIIDLELIGIRDDEEIKESIWDETEEGKQQRIEKWKPRMLEWWTRGEFD